MRPAAVGGVPIPHGLLDELLVRLDFRLPARHRVRARRRPLPRRQRRPRAGRGAPARPAGPPARTSGSTPPCRPDCGHARRARRGDGRRPPGRPRGRPPTARRPGGWRRGRRVRGPPRPLRGRGKERTARRTAVPPVSPAAGSRSTRGCSAPGAVRRSSGSSPSTTTPRRSSPPPLSPGCASTLPVDRHSRTGPVRDRFGRRVRIAVRGLVTLTPLHPLARRVQRVRRHPPAAEVVGWASSEGVTHDPPSRRPPETIQPIDPPNTTSASPHSPLRHNEQQIAYFTGRDLPRMDPLRRADTPYTQRQLDAVVAAAGSSRVRTSSTWGAVRGSTPSGWPRGASTPRAGPDSGPRRAVARGGARRPRRGGRPARPAGRLHGSFDVVPGLGAAPPR